MKISGIRYKDNIGQLGTVLGGSSLGDLAIRDTGFLIKSFQNANDDIALLAFQYNHDKQLATNVDDVHIHYYLPSAPAANNTIIFNWWWTWFNPTGNPVIPAIGSWNTGTPKTHTFVGTEPQYSSGIIDIINNLTYPTNESYSSILLVKIERNSTGTGADTYNDDLGIIFFDSHYKCDSRGSINVTSDVVS